MDNSDITLNNKSLKKNEKVKNIQYHNLQKNHKQITVGYSKKKMMISGF